MTYIADWKFADVLDELDVSPTELERITKEMGNDISRQSLYNLRKEGAKAVQFDTLAAIVPALSRVAGRRISLDELIVIRSEGVSKSGIPYTGDPTTDEILDDPEITKRLLISKAQYEGLSSEEIGEFVSKQLAEGQLHTLEDILKISE